MSGGMLALTFAHYTCVASPLGSTHPLLLTGRRNMVDRTRRQTLDELPWAQPFSRR